MKRSYRTIDDRRDAELFLKESRLLQLRREEIARAAQIGVMESRRQKLLALPTPILQKLINRVAEEISEYAGLEPMFRSATDRRFFEHHHFVNAVFDLAYQNSLVSDNRLFDRATIAKLSLSGGRR